MTDQPTAAETAAEIRRHLLAHDAGTLSTLSRADGIEGYPFGSLVPYALTGDCEPVFLMAGIAQHARNLGVDPRASLLVQQADPEEATQTRWRVTLVGEVHLVEAGEDFDTWHGWTSSESAGSGGWGERGGWTRSTSGTWGRSPGPRPRNPRPRGSRSEIPPTGG
jgi:hypothetical protein